MSLIGVKKVAGGSVTESFLVKGVAFKRTFSYAGFEQQPKSFSQPKILLLNLELELKSEKENAEVRLPTAHTCRRKQGCIMRTQLLINNCSS